MTQIEKIFRVKQEITQEFNNPTRQSIEATEDYAVKKVVESREIQTGDHNADGNRPEVVNVVYGTSGTPPAANTTPIGTLYIQYVN